MTSPTASSLRAYAENSPPSTSRTPIRRNSGPSAPGAGVHSEYVRRISAPSANRRTAMCCPAVKRNVSRSAGGTRRVTITASSVSRSTAATRSGWNAPWRGVARCTASAAITTP